MKVKKYLLLGILAGVMLFPVREIRAAERSCAVPLEEEGKNYYIDLDGDKKKEKIRYEIKNEEGKTQISLYVNNQVKTIKQKLEPSCKPPVSDDFVYRCDYWDVVLYNFDIRDKYKEIEVYYRCYGDSLKETKMNGKVYTRNMAEHRKIIVYRYEKKKLEEYFSLPKSMVKDGAYLCSGQPGNGTISIGNRINDISDTSTGDHYVYANYKLKNGKFEKIGNVKEYYSGNDEYVSSYRNFDNIKVRKTPNSSKTDFMLTVEDLFIGLRVSKYYVVNDVITHAYVELGDGRWGWCNYEDIADIIKN